MKAIIVKEVISCDVSPVAMFIILMMFFIIFIIFSSFYHWDPPMSVERRDCRNGWGALIAGPSGINNFNPGIFGTGFCKKPGIPGFCKKPGIPGFSGSGLA